jgi:hypothetical protein
MRYKKNETRIAFDQENYFPFIKVGLISVFYTLAPSSILTIFSLEGNAQDSSLAHFFKDGKYFCPRFGTQKFLSLFFFN